MNINKPLLAVLIVGILVSIYVTYVHYYPGALVCGSGNIINCESVITSQYSVILHVPLAVWSLTWFILALVPFSYFKNRLGVVSDIWFLGGIGGMMYSIVAQYLLLRICIWCLSLDALIALSIIFYFRKRV